MRNDPRTSDSPRSSLNRCSLKLALAATFSSFMAAGCSGESGTGAEDGALKGNYDEDWYQLQTVSSRVGLTIPVHLEWLGSDRVNLQFKEYDPGRATRCDVSEDANYLKAVDELGGVQWTYSISKIQDTSKPIFQKGYHFLGGDGDSGDISADPGAGVEIAEADIVGLSETSGLFLSKEHGLLVVDLDGSEAKFRCAAPLPGIVDQFYFYNDRLVVMVEDSLHEKSSLLHFEVTGDQLSFVESVDLGPSRVLDSRRFNDRLVLYTDLKLEGESVEPNYDDYYGEYDYGAPVASTSNHRVLRVFNWGTKLTEELSETRIEDAPTEAYLSSTEIDENTPIGTPVSQSVRFGSGMWASDKYFVVTESVTDVDVASWETQTYSVCVESHTVKTPYTSCSTQYKTVQNPAYVPPDNSGGDRSCTGSTLSSCIQKVSKESAQTIQVPTGRTCVQAERSHFVCDSYEQRSRSYPTYNRDTYTRLYIYEYTDDGFIRFQDDVAEVDETSLFNTDLESTLDVLPMTDAVSQLRISGEVQALQFQNGYLYVISEGLLQTYALATNSLIRTSSLPVSGGSIQTAQFTGTKLYLSDSFYNGGDKSVLRVIDLSNGAFPRQLSTDTVLPGGHESIRPTTSGILTTGYVKSFEGESVNLLKVGLFEDPSAKELSYLFIATDLERPTIGDPKATFYNLTQERLFLPYSGHLPDPDSNWGNFAAVDHRVGVSHIDSGALVSEGAIDLPQQPERVRPRPGTEEMLAFSSSSIQSLANGAEEWEATPVFEYFTPIGVYRYTDSDDYVEVLRLGNRCKLHFSPADDINDRTEKSLSEAFKCPVSFPVGYQQNLLWTQDFGVTFSADGSVEQLDEEAAGELWAKSQNRNVCLFSREVVEGALAVDPFEEPDLSTLRCYPMDVYWENAQNKNL